MLDTTAFLGLLPGTGLSPTEVRQAIIVQQAVNALEAHADGGQTGATAITAPVSEFSTVATEGDSAALPPAVPGVVLYVINGSAASMDVFPRTGEQINALGANNAFAIAGGKLGIFVCAVGGRWQAVSA